MNLFDGLKLLELVKDGEVKTYLASDPQRGRQVLLHWIPLGARLGDSRLCWSYWTAFRRQDRGLILEAGIREGRMYLITKNPARLLDLKDWLTRLARWQVADVTDPRNNLGEAPAPEEPGEFTKLFMPPSGQPPPAPLQAPTSPRSIGTRTRGHSRVCSIRPL